MLRKLNRRKVIRENFKLDKIYKGILLDKATTEEINIFSKNKVGRKYFDDDLFCNMLIQKEKFIINKITGHQTKRLFPFYPSFIPLVDVKTIVSKEEYYWTASSVEYNCIRCNKPTISILGDFSLKNVLCGKCIEKHYINKRGWFDKRLHDHEYSKFRQGFYEINKEHQNKVFLKLIKREKSLYSSDKSVPCGLKRTYTNKLNDIINTFNSLIK
tara:strand:- start:44 stop:685 length:642 start_codon:yes stop_codon:yes gene_type:complete